MKITHLAAALLIAVTSVAAHAADQNNFVIQTNGAPSGTCHYSFDKTKDGYKVTSHFQDRVKAVFQEADAIGTTAKVNTDVEQSHTYKLDANYAYTGGNVLTSSTQMNNGYSPNKTRTQMQLSAMQGGVQQPSFIIAMDPSLIVLPDFDASAVQTLLYQATAHPTADSNYFVVVPQAYGSPMKVSSHWTVQPDTTGTLAGAAVPLHHFSFAFGSKTYDVYGDATNTLMEVDVSGLNAKYIRTGFVLSADAAPAAK
jgi:hypothetical protein